MSAVLDICAQTGSATESPPQYVAFSEQQPLMRSSSVGAGSSSQRVVKVYSTTAEAIANFKPTSREVISGIAPHVFDERKRRKSQRRASGSYWYGPNGEKRSSPLRGATVLSWDEHSIYFEQPDSQRSSTERQDASSTHSRDVKDSQPDRTKKPAHSVRSMNLDKPRKKYFRIDIHLLR
ncbi:hypothetical protein B0H34DRAFT_62317 [Crassisporium funariophilum]|nr:hypothetical protein B0H34DRAFT_62317 [Crassisporium funariophilum]